LRRFRGRRCDDLEVEVGEKAESRLMIWRLYDML
jgi:hypothetical protein